MCINKASLVCTLEPNSIFNARMLERQARFGDLLVLMMFLGRVNGVDQSYGCREEQMKAWGS